MTARHPVGDKGKQGVRALPAFTPGPWFLSSGGGHIRANIGGIPRKVCIFKGNPNAEQDAPLIAAAPELLEALAPFAKLGWVGDLPDDHEFDAGFTVGDIRRARAAITHARGETK